MNQTARQVHAWVAWGFVASIVLQVFLAGLAIPQLGGNSNFSAHQGFGYAIFFIAIALVVAAVAAGAGRRRILQSLGLLGLYMVQSILPSLDPGLSVAAALHPLNAMVMFALAIWYARQVWRERSPASA